VKLAGGIAGRQSLNQPHPTAQASDRSTAQACRWRHAAAKLEPQNVAHAAARSYLIGWHWR